MKKIVGIFVCMLLIIPVISTTMAANNEQKYNVYISGRHLTDFDDGNSDNYYNLWHLSLFKADESGNWVNFSFTKKTLILLIINNEPSIIKGPVNIYLGLTEPETFMFFWWPTFSLIGIGRAKIFGVCDTIEIFEE